MTKTEAIAFFGNQKKLCAVIQRAKSTVSSFEEKLPRGVQFELQVKTNNALKADAEFFETRTDR